MYTFIRICMYISTYVCIVYMHYTYLYLTRTYVISQVAEAEGTWVPSQPATYDPVSKQHLKNIYIKNLGQGECLKCKSRCLESTRTWIQTLAPSKEKKKGKASSSSKIPPNISLIFCSPSILTCSLNSFLCKYNIAFLHIYTHLFARGGGVKSNGGSGGLH